MKLFKKLKEMPQGMKATVAFFLANLIMKGISYITTPLYTRLLSAEEYGQVSVYFTWMEIFGIIAMFCLSYGVFNNGMMDYPEKRDEYSFSMLILSNIFTLSFTAVLLCIYPLIREWIGLDYPLIILMCACFLFNPAHNFWAARQRYELKYKYTVFWSLFSAVLSPLIAILLIIFNNGHRLYARLFGTELTLIAINIGFYIYLAIKSKCKINMGYWKTAVLFNLPLIPHYLSAYLLSGSDKIMISYLIGDYATAYYSIAYSIAAVAMTFWMAINSSLIPYTYEKCRANDYNAISKVTLPILTVFAALCGMIMLIAPEVVAIMAPADYKEAIYAIPPIIAGVFFQIQYYIYANIVYYHKKPKYVMIASITATILNLVLNYIFIRKFGYIVAGYTTLVCYFIQATIDYFAMKKIVGQRVYNMRYIGLLSLLVCVVGIAGNILYNFTIVRYIVLLIIVVLCLVFRKKIISLIQAIRGKNET